jgi:signal transduction histidine kinase
VISNANAAASAMLRVRADRLIGKPLVVFVADASRPRLRRAITEIGATNTPTRVVGLDVVPRGGGEIRVEAAFTSSERSETGDVEIAWLLVDQTQRLQREDAERQRSAELETLVAARTAELERAQHFKDQLIATVSHEFRTALGAIGGYAEMLTLGVHGHLTDEQSSDVNRIQRAYAHLARLVDDLLNLNKASAGQLSLDIDDLSLADVLRGLSDLVGPQAAAKNIHIDDSTGGAHLIVRVDPERVRQIILNLVANAVKFCAPGAVIRLDVRVEDDAAIIGVHDTGPGIPLDKLDVIFEPFVRLDQGSGIPGSGLGLAISREMARAMGGELTAVSDVGRGSSFTLKVPLSTRRAPRSE